MSIDSFPPPIMSVYYLTEKPDCSWLKGITILSLRQGEGPAAHIFLSEENKTTLISELAFTEAPVEESTLLESLEGNPNATEIKTFLKMIHVMDGDLDDEHLIVPDLTDYDDTTLRFRGAQWFEVVKSLNITMVGLGGIGSHTAVMLSRFQPQFIMLYDNDKVEAVNLAGQLYTGDDIGSYKTAASYRNMEKFSNFHRTSCFSHRYTEATHSTEVMICGLDSMEARMDCFASWLRTVNSKQDPSDCLYIDGRLAAEELQVFCITGDCAYDIERYKQMYLFPSSEAEEATCSYKQTAYMANMIAGVICNLVANFCANKVIPNFRSLPFLTTYNGYTMSFKTTE